MKLSNLIFDLPIIMSPQKLALVGLTLLFLSGCGVAIPLPNPEPEPFPEKVTGTIVPGKTSRKDVLATLGNPRSASIDGKLFLYAEEQITELQIAYVFIAGDISLGGPTHYYIISFARNGTVANTKRVTNINNYCRRDGSCLVLEDDLDAWYAPLAIEASAKKFTPISDKCTIYFWSMGSDMELKIVLDRRKTLQFPKYDLFPGFTIGGSFNRFFHRTVVPAGIHEFSYPKESMSEFSGMSIRYRPLSFQCHAGDIVFVEPSNKYSYKARTWWFEFTLVDPEKAKRKILRSRMLAPDI